MENNKESSSEGDEIMDTLPWDKGMIFDFIEGGERGLCRNGTIYYDHKLEMDIGPFKAGHICNIRDEGSPFGNDYRMFIGCDREGNGGELFVLMWNHIPSKEKQVVRGQN